MRHWLFHPLIFYPVMIALAALVVAVSLRPQAWPRDPAPAAAAHNAEWLVYEGQSFDSPEAGSQAMTVMRDFWGRPLRLRVAQKRKQATAPVNAEDGARILITPEDSAAISGRPVTVEVSYNPLPINAATALAISLNGDGPTEWVIQTAPPQSATLRFRLPARASVQSIGIRPISALDDQAYGLEITRIRVTPRT